MNIRLPKTLDKSLPNAASNYAKLGWHVVPMRADRSGAHQKYANQSSPKPELASEFFREWPDALLCIKLPRNVVVLDVDPRARSCLEIVSELNSVFELPATCCIRTPKGGVHLWYELPEGVTARNWTSQHGKFPIDGVDIRTNGGLATLPPSRRSDGDYSWHSWTPIVPIAPKTLVDALCPSLDATLSHPVAAKRFSGNPTQYGQSALEDELRKVAMSAVGGRNHALFVAAANLGSLHAAQIIPDVRQSLVRAADVCGLARDDGRRSCTATIESGWRRGLANPRAVNQGWNNA